MTQRKVATCIAKKTQMRLSQGGRCASWTEPFFQLVVRCGEVSDPVRTHAQSVSSHCLLQDAPAACQHVTTAALKIKLNSCFWWSLLSAVPNPYHSIPRVRVNTHTHTHSSWHCGCKSKRGANREAAWEKNKSLPRPCGGEILCPCYPVGKNKVSHWHVLPPQPCSRYNMCVLPVFTHQPVFVNWQICTVKSMAVVLVEKWVTALWGMRCNGNVKISQRCGWRTMLLWTFAVLVKTLGFKV